MSVYRRRCRCGETLRPDGRCVHGCPPARALPKRAESVGIPEGSARQRFQHERTQRERARRAAR